MFNVFQKLLPKHLLSRFLGKMAHCRCRFFKNKAIRCFIRYFQVDLSESAVNNIEEFPSFNDFFIRHLKPDARPLFSAPSSIVSPADGVVSEFGDIQSARLLQAKGKYYPLPELVGEDKEMISLFSTGQFFTIYLAPKDYHRVHSPLNGKLLQMTYIPGQLFSVNATSVKGIKNLFSRNERVVCLFETPTGKMAVIFVGAMLVGSVVTPWHGQVMPSQSSRPSHQFYADASFCFQRGEEIGYFQWGSTVILLMEKETAAWETHLQPNQSIKMGQPIGRARSEVKNFLE